MNIVITGTSKGIGLELCRVALNKKHRVCAVARSPQKSTELSTLMKDYPQQLSVVDADLMAESSLPKIHAAVKDWDAIDVLINNAGIYEKDLSLESLLNSFRVNSIAPLLLTQTLLPQLRKSEHPTTVHITSKMGSIADNTSGGSYAYRASKTALNMLNKSLAVDNPWLTAMVVHPGWVQTSMGGSQAPTSAHESVQGIWALIEKAQPSMTGRFWDYKGAEIAW